MRRDQIDFSETTIANESHPDYGKVQYHAMLKHPYPKGVKGCPLGRSLAGHDAAYRDLCERVKAESGVALGPLRDISDADIFLAVNRMFTTPDVDMTAALKNLRVLHGKLVDLRRRKHDEEEERLASARQVWLRRYVIEYTQVEISDYRDYEDQAAMIEAAIDNADDSFHGWEHVENGQPWVTEITLTDGSVVWSEPKPDETRPYEREV